MKLLDIACKLGEKKKRGYTNIVIDTLRNYGLAEYAYGYYWAVIPSHVLLEISWFLPKCVYKKRQHNSPTVGDFIDVARRYDNTYFSTMIRPYGHRDGELFSILAIYIPLEEKDLIEWAKSFIPDVIGLVEYKGQYFVYCWWE